MAATLPHREKIELNPSAYDRFLEQEAIPVIKGHYVEDILAIELKPWKRMGALGCYLNLGGQQDTDAYVCEIPPKGKTLPQHHLFETIIYVASGRGATTVWLDEKSKQSFEWSAGAVFAIPLNATYQHFNVSHDTAVRFLAGTNCPHLLNLFHNEDFIFADTFQFRDRFRAIPDYFRLNRRLADRCWETNLIPDVNRFELDDFPMKGKGVRIMRFTLAGTTYGCHIQEFPATSRSLFHRHGPGAVLIVTEGEGYAVMWRDDEPRVKYSLRPNSIYSPGDLMYHAHFNCGHSTMRHFAMRGRSPQFNQDRYRTSLHNMLPLDQEPPGIHKDYLEELSEKGIQGEVSVVKE